MRNDLVALLGPDRVLSRPIDLIRFATDASPYRLFPKVVVIARTVRHLATSLAKRSPISCGVLPRACMPSPRAFS
jgi:D-lactate dehydrogenase